MKALIQLVEKAQVMVDQECVGSIEKGLLVFLGIHKDDVPETTSKLAKKIAQLRIFNDDLGKMNLSVKDVKGSILIVSQFTLYGNCLSGRRPDFLASAPPALAEPIYEKFVEAMKQEGIPIATGRFGAPMKVSLVNDGP